jgi:thymidylate synthase (FAD)
MLERIEAAGRTCYKSEDQITETSADAFVRKIVKSGHHSVLEHEVIQVRFITDRGVTHELVRHRLASFSQESTRYCDYGDGDIQFILPVRYEKSKPEAAYSNWVIGMEEAERRYLLSRQLGESPQEARDHLPNSLKTEIVVTANLREWMHILDLRTSKAAHPQIRALMLPLLEELGGYLPQIFGALWETRR